MLEVKNETKELSDEPDVFLRTFELSYAKS